MRGEEVKIFGPAACARFIERILRQTQASCCSQKTLLLAPALLLLPMLSALPLAFGSTFVLRARHVAQVQCVVAVVDGGGVVVSAAAAAGAAAAAAVEAESHWPHIIK